MYSCDNYVEQLLIAICTETTMRVRAFLVLRQNWPTYSPSQQTHVRSFFPEKEGRGSKAQRFIVTDVWGAWECSLCAYVKKETGMVIKGTKLCWVVYLTYGWEGPSRWLDGNKSACQAGNASSMPELGRSPRERNGSPLQYSCLGNPMDRGVWRDTVHGVAKSQTQLSG